jgi:hypothetical protein
MTPYAQMLANDLRPECQAAFAYEYQRYAKDVSLAQLLTVLLGIVGGEAYYFGEYKRGILMTLALLSGVGMLISVPLWIVRIFTIAGETETYNDYLAYALACRYISVEGLRVAPQPPPQPAGRAPIGGVPMRTTMA